MNSDMLFERALQRLAEGCEFYDLFDNSLTLERVAVDWAKVARRLDIRPAYHAVMVEVSSIAAMLHAQTEPSLLPRPARGWRFTEVVLEPQSPVYSDLVITPKGRALAAAGFGIEDVHFAKALSQMAKLAAENQGWLWNGRDVW